jgi:hypothetical protein
MFTSQGQGASSIGMAFAYDKAEGTSAWVARIQGIRREAQLTLAWVASQATAHATTGLCKGLAIQPAA